MLDLSCREKRLAFQIPVFLVSLSSAMRLLHIQKNGALSLVECVGIDIPPYAILSHTWGPSSEEVSYQDMMNGTAMGKSAYCKFLFCIERATKDNLAYFWVDTCCIDKSSSAELSESITSMFRWYQDSARCYVYLQDVFTKKRKADYDLYPFVWESAFRTSRWFTRGWTLQELLAPSVVRFYSADGKFLGDKSSLEDVIHEITHIPIFAIRGAPLQHFDVNERMSWATGRHTTREEDGAYCLLGIFGISMSTIYGEGQESAFRRLARDIREVTQTGILPLTRREKRVLLNSLRFDQIDARYLSIEDAHKRTCEWILSDPTYLKWHNEMKFEDHHGFLWIKGKPGSGKSTLMKSILANVRGTMQNRTVVSFFFNARGEELERSTLGMYRSLLWQLLQRYPELQNILDTLGLANTNFFTHTWTIDSLKSLLKQAVKGLGESSLICFVDALDECEIDEIRDMIQFFESIGDLAALHNVRFQTCYSSRYYPYISVRKGLSIRLERQEGHIQDITNYVATELKLDNESGTAGSIRAEIQKKASGIFMWVVLVVSMLNRESDAGRVHTLQRRLHDLPGDLHKLFRDIITRDSRYQDELLLCIQLVLFAKSPLSPEELYFAVLTATEPRAAFQWNRQEISEDTIARFILNSSKGLVSITTSYQPRVQFIHESVRDFLLKENELSDIWPEVGKNLTGHSHGQYKHCCLMYLTMNFPSIAMMLEDDRNEFEYSLVNEITENFPFLEYAVHCVLYHADLAEENGFAQKEFLEDFPLPEWIKLINVYMERSRQYTEHATFVYILAEHNMVNLLKIHPAASRCFEMEPQRYGCPLFAAIASGNHGATRACLDAIEIKEAANRPLYESQDKRNSRNHFQYPSREDFAYSEARGPFRSAVELGGEDLATLLASLGCIRDNFRDEEGRTPLWWATRYEWDGVVKLLLVNTATSCLDIQDKDGKSALYVAIEADNQTMVRLLVDAGANVNLRGGFYGNLLHAAARKGVVDIVRRLLDAGADVNSKADFYGNALQAAAYGGHKEVVELLLSRGADMNARGSWGSAVTAASRHNHEEVVQLLRDKGAR
jgi:hypothetical protein